MSNINNKIIGGEYALSHGVIQAGTKSFREWDENRKYFFSSGRCALYAILKDMEQMFTVGGVMLPDYLCDSITRTVVDAGWNYSFYHVDCDFHICTDSFAGCASKNKAILLIDYFGMTDLSADIFKIRSLFTDVIIIADCVQAFYSMEKYDADYCFTSFRKWFSCPDGAMVIKRSSDKMVELELNDGTWWQYKYAGNILKEYQEQVHDSIVLDLLEQGEERLDKDYLCRWNEASRRIFLSLDLKEIEARRKRNAKYLHEQLVKMDVDHLYSECGTPLFLPLLIEKRDDLRKLFFKESIFTPKHWPVLSTELNGSNVLYDKELSLICDQRYTLEDMEKQISVIRNCR